MIDLDELERIVDLGISEAGRTGCMVSPYAVTPEPIQTMKELIQMVRAREAALRRVLMVHCAADELPADMKRDQVERMVERYLGEVADHGISNR